MIAFGIAISDPQVFRHCALPGIERAAGLGAPVHTRRGLTIRRAYNEILDEAAAEPGLEALVLLHQDLELADDSLPCRLRRIFADPRVGLVGSLGARDLEPHRWFAPGRFYGTAADPILDRRFSSGADEVEGVDGQLLAIAPWAARGLRFGDSPGGDFHGYDVDISLRVRAYGGTVVCDDIPYVHHRLPKHDFEAQRRAGIGLARAWDPGLRPPEWEPAFQA